MSYGRSRCCSRALATQPTFPCQKSLIEESSRRGNASSSSFRFQIGTLGQWSGTISKPEPSAMFFLWVPLATFALLWGLRSFEGARSPSSSTSLSFLFLFFFFPGCLVGEVQVVIGVRDQGWTATSGVDPPTFYSNSSRRLVFFLH